MSQLSMPHAFVDYKGMVQIKQEWDDRKVTVRQGPEPFTPVESPVDPLITIQAVRNNGEVDGPVYAYDYERSDWLVYDDRIHEVPKSGPVEVGAPSRFLDMSAKSSVEMESEIAPASDVPPDEVDIEEAPMSYGEGGEEDDDEV